MLLSGKLSYPLQPAALMAALAFYAAGVLLFILFKVSLTAGVLGWVIWARYVFSITALMTYLLFEYGMDVLDSSARGVAEPPTVRGTIVQDDNASLYTVGNRRFLKQLLVVLFYVGGVGMLERFDLGWLGTLALVWLFITWPAILLINGVYNQFLDMLNPMASVRAIANTGPFYIFLLILTNGATLVGVLALIQNVVAFVLLFPCFLYLWLLAMHFLGATVHENEHDFLTFTDFKADRLALRQISRAKEAFNATFTKAHELLRAQKPDEANKLIDDWLYHSGWNDFDEVFDYISQWAFTGPALRLCGVRIPKLVEQHPMRALELARWSVKTDNGFTLADFDTIVALMDAAADYRQHLVVLCLLRNHALQYPERREPALRMGMAIAADKLKDPGEYAALQKLAAEPGLRAAADDRKTDGK